MRLVFRSTRKIGGYDATSIMRKMAGTRTSPFIFSMSSVVICGAIVFSFSTMRAYTFLNFLQYKHRGACTNTSSSMVNVDADEIF